MNFQMMWVQYGEGEDESKCEMKNVERTLPISVNII